MPPKKTKMAKKKIVKRDAFTVRPHPMTGMGVKVNNRTGQMWQIDPITGKGIWGDIWSGIKKGVGWLKDNKVISTVAKMIPHPIAQQVGSVAGTVGMGRRAPIGYVPSPMVR